MKNNLIKNIFLYFSAFVPMYVLIVVKFCVGMLVKSIDTNLLSYIVLSTYTLLIIFGIVGYFWNTKFNKEQSVNIVITKKQNITDQHFLGYFSLFVFFALTFELTKVSMFVISIIIIVFIGIVYVNNKMFYINPLLNLLGYNFYEISYHKEDKDTIKQAKMFYKGELHINNKPCKAKIKNQNFSFIE